MSPKPDRASLLSPWELRVALIAGKRLSDSLRDGCGSFAVPVEWSGSWLKEARPHMLLIESEGVDHGGGGAWTPDEIGDLIDACRAAEVPSAAWVVGRASPRGFPAGLLDRVDRVFGSDPAAVRTLAGRTSNRPSVLPHAASSSALRAGGGERGGIAYVGRYSRHWALPSREFVEALLDVASPLGLRILARTEAEIGGLPGRFAALVRPAADTDQGVEALRDCRVLIDFEPDEGVARPIFDALAAGVLVIAPRNYIAMRVLPTLVAYPRSVEGVAADILWCLQRGLEQEERSAAGRKAMRNAHTYQHRLATVASALGYAVLPDPPEEG